LNALDKLFPLLSVLAFFSPLAASICAAVFYGRHCRARPDPGRHLPVIAYGLLCLGCAIVAGLIGINFGIRLACSAASAGNLCGLWGFFVGGPFAAALGICFAGAMLMLLPADQPSDR
jgi:hypothetical protein